MDSGLNVAAGKVRSMVAIINLILIVLQSRLKYLTLDSSSSNRLDGDTALYGEVLRPDHWL